jgi:pimeloyl-ACP methyl ester carboxylesterase
VLVHGVGSNLGGWNAVCRLLGDSFDILRLDLRGHGQSAPIEGDFSIDDFARDVLSMMDQEGVEQAHLIGFSLGGLIAQRLASEWPDRFNRVVILSAVAGRTPEERAKVVARLDMIRTGGMEAITGAATDRWFTEGFAAQHPEIIARRIAELKAVHLPSYLEAYRIFGLTELEDRLHLIPHETLVMTGECDIGSNVRMAETMHRLIPNAQLRILPGLKHSVLVEAPDLIAQHARDFLQERRKDNHSLTDGE